MVPSKSETFFKKSHQTLQPLVTTLFFIGEKSPESNGRKSPAKSIKGKRGKSKITLPYTITFAELDHHSVMEILM
jgi:hypothetical protein